MKTTELNLLTIVSDQALRHVIEEDLQLLGASGYTISTVEGKGKSGERTDSWSGNNVKIESIINDIVLDKILQCLSAKYLSHYPVIAYYEKIQTMIPS